MLMSSAKISRRKKNLHQETTGTRPWYNKYLHIYTMKTKLDHLVIAADNLEKGVAYVRERLGVDIPYGGVHMKMGTHNHVMRLGDDIFLEVIAINPDIDPPERPRWFGLDDPFVRRQISEQPVLLSWVVNTKDIMNFLQQTTFSFGKAELLSRNNLSWYFALPDDGRLLAGGMLPYAIEWQTDIHPSIDMVDCGCRFQGLEIYHSHSVWLHSVLQSIEAESLVNISTLPPNTAPYLKAYINTPNGVKELCGGFDKH